ncbi:MAG: hypothetical protein BWY50_02138 [Spirochaetes bacterium ADurb.Bin315]|nr:MAG: hypothetical protein BWY50_02138 [Spirochaetes bacterium ADurb.Bin315]
MIRGLSLFIPHHRGIASSFGRDKIERCAMNTPEVINDRAYGTGPCSWKRTATPNTPASMCPYEYLLTIQ